MNPSDKFNNHTKYFKNFILGLAILSMYIQNTLCQQYPTSITLQNPLNNNQTYDKVATNYIKMLPGFVYSAVAGGNTFTARIDNSITWSM